MKGFRKILAVAVIGMAAASVLTGCTTIDSLGRTNERGVFQNISVLAAKDWSSLGLVFTEVSFDTDKKGQHGDVFTYQALLKEAQQLGADTIINVVIDVKNEESREYQTFPIKMKKGIVSGKETWFGSATAIKYGAALKEVVTTVTGNTTVTKEGAVLNLLPVNPNRDGASSGGGTNSDETTSKKMWWNPLTWFKK